VEREGRVQPRQRGKFDYRSSRALVIAFPAVYAAVFIVFCLIYKVYPGPEFLVLLFLIYAAYNRRSWRFVKDWVPFVALFLSYEAMYGVIGSISGIVHVLEPIGAEMQIFGAIPTLFLQQFYRTSILDYLGAFFYSLHFIVPTVFGLVVWKFYPKSYWKYTLALGICTYSALLTFLIYPVAPPWFGVKATRILFQIDSNLGVPVYRTIFDYIQPNPFAAFPSLHSTFPWLVSLFALKIKKIKALPILVLPLGVWFSAVYLGEHYIVDVIGGIGYASFAFLLVEKIIPRFSSRYAILLKKYEQARSQIALIGARYRRERPLLITQELIAFQTLPGLMSLPVRSQGR
jgi:membrane-associated phospholipid phosphatase